MVGMTSADLEQSRTAASPVGPTGDRQALAQLDRRALRQLWRELIGTRCRPRQASRYCAIAWPTARARASLA